MQERDARQRRIRIARPRADEAVDVNPYRDRPDYTRWDRAVAAVGPTDVDPVTDFPLRITREDAIVSAGSCFAQHISRHLQQHGFNYLVTEPGHPLLDDELKRSFGYGVFSARYGNIYTSRQLLQLFQRAYGQFTPEEGMWSGKTGLVDPVRPAIQPVGFATIEELEADRVQHLAAVRKAFEELAVFVFTLGLTECWTSRADGTAFPLAPGVAGGVFDPDRHELVNLTVADVERDLTAFMEALAGVNPSAQVILTVSPVPLIATAVDRHVLVSTTYSKAVLRVAAEQVAQATPAVHYFPSFEIVTGAHARGSYFADDLRSVREAGVEHVMRLFVRHATEGLDVEERAERAPTAAELRQAAARAFDREMREVVEAMCDEELLLGLGASAAP